MNKKTFLILFLLIICQIYPQDEETKILVKNLIHELKEKMPFISERTYAFSEVDTTVLKKDKIQTYLIKNFESLDDGIKPYIVLSFGWHGNRKCIPFLINQAEQGGRTALYCCPALYLLTGIPRFMENKFSIMDKKKYSLLFAKKWWNENGRFLYKKRHINTFVVNEKAKQKNIFVDEKTGLHSRKEAEFQFKIEVSELEILKHKYEPFFKTFILIKNYEYLLTQNKKDDNSHLLYASNLHEKLLYLYLGIPGYEKKTLEYIDKLLTSVSTEEEEKIIYRYIQKTILSNYSKIEFLTRKEVLINELKTLLNSKNYSKGKKELIIKQWLKMIQ